MRPDPERRGFDHLVGHSREGFLDHGLRLPGSDPSGDGPNRHARSLKHRLATKNLRVDCDSTPRSWKNFKGFHCKVQNATMRLHSPSAARRADWLRPNRAGAHAPRRRRSRGRPFHQESTRTLAAVRHAGASCTGNSTARYAAYRQRSVGAFSERATYHRQQSTMAVRQPRFIVFENPTQPFRRLPIVERFLIGKAASATRRPCPPPCASASSNQ